MKKYVKSKSLLLDIGMLKSGYKITIAVSNWLAWSIDIEGHSDNISSYQLITLVLCVLSRSRYPMEGHHTRSSPFLFYRALVVITSKGKSSCLILELFVATTHKLFISIIISGYA